MMGKLKRLKHDPALIRANPQWHIEASGGVYTFRTRERAVQARLLSKNRKIRNRRISSIGAVVEAHAQHDAQFADYLWTILKNRVTHEADREFLGLPPKNV